MRGLEHYLNATTALPAVLLEFVRLRASLLNGCSFCVGHHIQELGKHNEPETRIEALRDWPASDAFTPRERAALAWTDAVTNIQGSHASDEEYAAVSAFFEGKDLVDLTLAIAGINAWNRMSIAFGAQWDPSRGPRSQNQNTGAAQAAGTEAPGSGLIAPVATVGRRGEREVPAAHGTASAPKSSTPAHENATTQDVVDDDGGKVARD